MRYTADAGFSGSGSSICGRSVVSCDVAKSAVTPDDRELLLASLLERERQPLANGIAVRKKSRCERFGNDGHTSGRAAVLGSDAAAPQQPCAYRVEISFRDARDVSADELRAIRLRNPDVALGEVDRHAVPHRHRERRRSPPRERRGRSGGRNRRCRAWTSRRDPARAATSPSVSNPKSAVRTRSSITPLITRKGTAMAT